MHGMFWEAASFNGDLSTWNVSRVNDMSLMFYNAASFAQRLCTTAWVRSEANKDTMFEGSRGSICTPSTQSAATPAAHQNIAQRAIPDRELIARMAMSTAGAFASIASPSVCPKCGTFQKSGRVSCCAPGGAWYQNCGGADNRNVDHTWIEGMEACKGEFEPQM